MKKRNVFVFPPPTSKQSQGLFASGISFLEPLSFNNEGLAFSRPEDKNSFSSAFDQLPPSIPFTAPLSTHPASSAPFHATHIDQFRTSLPFSASASAHLPNSTAAVIPVTNSSNPLPPSEEIVTTTFSTAFPLALPYTPYFTIPISTMDNATSSVTCHNNSDYADTYLATRDKVGSVGDRAAIIGAGCASVGVGGHDASIGGGSGTAVGGCEESPSFPPAEAVALFYPTCLPRPPPLEMISQPMSKKKSQRKTDAVQLDEDLL